MEHLQLLYDHLLTRKHPSPVLTAFAFSAACMLIAGLEYRIAVDSPQCGRNPGRQRPVSLACRETKSPPRLIAGCSGADKGTRGGRHGPASSRLAGQVELS